MDECNSPFKLPQHLDTILLNGLIARGIGRKEGRRAWYFSATHPQQSKAVLDQKSWQPQIVPDVNHMWHTEAVHEFDLANTQDMGLKFYQTFSCAVVHLGDIPSECIARVVGHDRSIIKERPSEVAPSALAIQTDVRASGDQPQKRLCLIGSRGMRSPNKDEFFFFLRKKRTTKTHTIKQKKKTTTKTHTHTRKTHTKRKNTFYFSIF